MCDISVNKCVYSVHPVYDLYASDENMETSYISLRKCLTKVTKSITVI